jgi:signal transduction histidine kinase
MADAESLADAESCSWVLYGVERLRAHALLAVGKRRAAIERARLAETVALEHGAAVRARWIREELGLTPATPAGRSGPGSTSLSSTSSTRHRQLAALLHVLHAPQPNLTPEQQAVSVLDELVADFGAAHAYLYFDPTDGGASIRLGRTRAGGPWTDLPEGRQGLVEAVRERGEIWPPPVREGESTTLLRDVADGHVVVAPLSLYESTVGAVLIERAASAAPFGDNERQLLGVLMHQIPIALELARVLAEREELELNLRQARKMEAVGQLAGGVAHDFNNMLQAIRAAAEVVRGSAGLGADAVDEIDVISQAAERATSLTRQLLAFSRHRPAPLSTHAIGELLDALEPLLGRVSTRTIMVALSVASESLFVRVDRPALEQAIVNLVKNAGDAMPDGGTVTISAAAVDLDAAAVRRGAPKPGPYVCVRVADHGHGIKPELLERIFDPFFTTKAFGSNTGLGLTTVYAFAKNSGGYVDVTSAVGRGTTVSLFLPRLSAPWPAAAPAVRARQSNTVGKGELVLVVDDEPLVARSTSKILERHGFRVLVASGGHEAIEVARARAAEVRAAVIDIVMPDMNGPEVARRLAEIGVEARRLFVSGYAAGAGEPDASELLQKPFTPEELVARVRALLDD